MRRAFGLRVKERREKTEQGTATDAKKFKIDQNMAQYALGSTPILTAAISAAYFLMII